MKKQQEKAEAEKRKEQRRKEWEVAQRKKVTMSLREARATPEPEGKFPVTKIKQGVPYPF